MNATTTFSEQLRQLQQRLRELDEHGPGPQALANAEVSR